MTSGVKSITILYHHKERFDKIMKDMANKNPRRIRVEPHPDPKKRKAGEKIKALSLDFNVIEEHRNIYTLEDGTKVRIRATASGFTLALDYKTEEPLYNPDGQPMYGVLLNVETTFESSESVIKKGVV
ncbi:MAG: hypothetical protein JXB43_05760 [Dehalococcoidia bacterium]|nr:hypothetical protein [Dehalococcoidia bacterium]